MENAVKFLVKFSCSSFDTCRGLQTTHYSHKRPSLSSDFCRNLRQRQNTHHLDDFIAHSKNSTHLKLRKLPKLFCSSNVCDFLWTASFLEGCGGTTFTDTAQVVLVFPPTCARAVLTHVLTSSASSSVTLFSNNFEWLCRDVTVRKQKRANASLACISLSAKALGQCG